MISNIAFDCYVILNAKVYIIDVTNKCQNVPNKTIVCQSLFCIVYASD